MSSSPTGRITGSTQGGTRLAASAFEFQMLYGIRYGLAQELVADGHSVRICVPFGDDWFVYFARRLAERPASIFFLLRSLVGR